MGSFYSGDLNARDHIHIDIKCIFEEAQGKYCLKMVSIRLLGGFISFKKITPWPVSALSQNRAIHKNFEAMSMLP